MMGKPLRRLKLTVAYDGRAFKGWQSQPCGGGVQDAIEAALRKFGEAGEKRIIVHGSGRTDAGVHALAQTAHIDVPASRFQEPARWLAAINSDLPAEVRIVRARWAPASFHARFSATGKIYRYRVWNSRILPPLEIGRVWPIYDPIDLERLHECARLLTGRHDFGGFAANRGTPEEDTTRTIRRIGIRGKPGGLIELQFEGDGFLYRMVRLMTGSMVRCARGKADPAWLAGLLEPPMPSAMDQPRRKTSFAAPAEGLYLVRVLYGAKPRSQRAASV